MQTAPQGKTISEPAVRERTEVKMLTAISVCHLLNDMIQSLLPSMYPILKTSFGLSFTEIGLITLTFQVTASLLQPVIGNYTDRKPMPFSLPLGMLVTLFGVVLLGVAPTFVTLLVAAVLIGVGSAIFHPESSRVARLASGGKHGLAQSFFQVGGNAGSAVGPLLAATIVLPRGQIGVIWFSLAALAGIPILSKVGRWYASRLEHFARSPQALAARRSPVPRKKVLSALAVLMALVFSKYFYLASFTSYYTFYLISRFHTSVSGVPDLLCQ